MVLNTLSVQNPLDSTSSINLDNYVRNSTKIIRNATIMTLLQTLKLSKEKFIFFTKQRAKLAFHFKILLKKVISDSALMDRTLEIVFKKNLADEEGMDAEGNIHHELSHDFWLSAYLNELNISKEVLDKTPPLQGTLNHINKLIQLAESEDLYSIVGAVLFMERIIPIEYRAVQISRDYLFPEQFIISASDSEHVKKRKSQARLFIDDHIIHDAKNHYPDMLNALKKYDKNKNIINNIMSGINLIKECRNNFYNDLAASLDL